MRFAAGWNGDDGGDEQDEAESAGDAHGELQPGSGSGGACYGPLRSARKTRAGLVRQALVIRLPCRATTAERLWRNADCRPSSLRW